MVFHDKFTVFGIFFFLYQDSFHRKDINKPQNYNRKSEFQIVITKFIAMFPKNHHIYDNQITIWMVIFKVLNFRDLGS